MRRLLTSYFGIVRNNLADYTVKIVMYSLVNDVSKTLNQALVTALYDEKNLDNLLAESPAATKLREEAQSKMALVQKAKGILQEAELLNEQIKT